jgi:hypothetical protein
LAIQPKLPTMVGGTPARSAAYQWQSVSVQPNAMKLIPLRLGAISDN